MNTTDDEVPLQGLLVGALVVICIARVALLASGGGLAAVVRDPTLFLIVALLALLLLRELVKRPHLLRHQSPTPKRAAQATDPLP